MTTAPPITVTPDSFSTITAALPTALRSALSMAARIERGQLTVILPDRRKFVFRGREAGPDATIDIRDYAVARRLLTGGDLGFAESFLRGEWDSPNLVAFLELFCVNHEIIKRLLDGRPFTRLVQAFRRFLNRNTRRGSRRNIEAHYDLGNAFYETWLDRTMTYSSAMFAPGDNDLASAQTRKYRQLAENLGLTAEHHVLEIGCGWGGFAEFAASEIGCRVTGLTISPAQFEFATKRIAAAGLSDKVTIKLQDYRDETGTYDRIASIEMFEAVGEEYWPVFFRKMSDVLKPGGRAGLQIITIQDRLFEDYRKETDYIQHYVFPGGMLPCPAILKRLGDKVGLGLSATTEFGLDYARTLAVWRDRFRAAWPTIERMAGFDERFRRQWEYYLAYCEAGFRAGNIDVRQLVYVKG